jgi:prephenate dehydrogenase
VPSQQPQGQLQTEHSVDTGNYIMDKQSIKSNQMEAMEEKHNKAEKQTNKKTK